MQEEVKRLNQLVQGNDVLSCMEISFRPDSDSILIFVEGTKCGRISKKRCDGETDESLFMSLRRILAVEFLDKLWHWNDLLETTKYLGLPKIAKSNLLKTTKY